MFSVALWTYPTLSYLFIASMYSIFLFSLFCLDLNPFGFNFLSNLSLLALNSLICADVPLRNCSLTHSLNVLMWREMRGDRTAEHLLLLCPKWAAECQRYFGDSIDITDVFQDYESLVEFLISSGHLSPHIGSAWQARHDNNNNNVLMSHAGSWKVTGRYS